MESMRCPACSVMIGVTHVRFPHFACPNCRSEICIPSRYLFKARLLGAAIAFLGCYLMGLSGAVLVVCGVLFSVLVGTMLTTAGMVVSPPVVEKYFHPGSLGLKS